MIFRFCIDTTFFIQISFTDSLFVAEAEEKGVGPIHRMYVLAGGVNELTLVYILDRKNYFCDFFRWSSSFKNFFFVNFSTFWLRFFLSR